MAVSIFPPSTRDLTTFQTNFALQQDNWNDFSFQTLYHLYYQSRVENQSIVRIGSVKILRHGQTKADGIQITAAFEKLSTDFCSVGTSLDYYKRLNEILDQDRNEIVTALRDVVALPNLQAEFEGEEGWKVSLFRDDPNPKSFLEDAAAIFSNNYAALPDLQLSFTFLPTGWTSSLKLQFDSPQPQFYFGKMRVIGPSKHRVLLPRRIVVLIGKNGSGKSTLLSRIARVAFASPSDRARKELQRVGTFEPTSIGFTRIIAISYSAFDNFMVPGVSESDLKQIARDVEKGSGRYIYAGLRDIAAEVRDDLESTETNAEGDNESMVFRPQERRTKTRLKSLLQLAEEFERLLAQIAVNGDEPLLDAALEPLLADGSFVDIESNSRKELFGKNPRDAFLGWSNGHKIVFHVITSLVAHATRKSLVLFDEPETHLHPPLTAALMNSVRIILEEKNAFAIVATHSPVVVQETLARHVRIVSRVADRVEIRVPTIETFGENVGILTYDTFGLKAAGADFYAVLDLLVEELASIDEINKLFTPRLSGQALAYVMTGLARKGKSS